MNNESIITLRVLTEWERVTDSEKGNDVDGGRYLSTCSEVIKNIKFFPS